MDRVGHCYLHPHPSPRHTPALVSLVLRNPDLGAGEKVLVRLTPFPSGEPKLFLWETIFLPFSNEFAVDLDAGKKMFPKETPFPLFSND
jgi:hypothetical protein